jgi:hypothetical protein
MGRQSVARFPWLEWVLLPVSYLLILGGPALAVRAALVGSAAAADYAAAAAALVAGLFGLAACDLLGQVHELHTRLGRLEFNQAGNLPRGDRSPAPGPGAEG